MEKPPGERVGGFTELRDNPGTTYVLLFLLVCVTTNSIIHCPSLEGFAPFVTLNEDPGDVQLDLKD